VSLYLPSIPLLISLAPLHLHSILFLFCLGDLVLEDVEVVTGCHGDDVFLWVPGGVEDLLTEVQTVNSHLVFTTLPTHTHLERRGSGKRR
jgi:hypothetical protein